MATSKISWTWTDEAPALATRAFLPILEAFMRGTGIEVETRDISLAGRVIANFPDRLAEEQKIPDHLTQLGELAQTPEANIVKLPNIRASIPQLQDAIAELSEEAFFAALVEDFLVFRAPLALQDEVEGSDTQPSVMFQKMRKNIPVVRRE